MTASIKHILCPIDFTTCSENALRYALQLADVYGADIQLLHVLMPASESVMDVPGSIPVVNRKLEDDTREAMVAMIDRVMNEVGELLSATPTIESHIDIGTPGFLINEAASTYHADLVVMGTKRQEDRPWYLGSVAGDALHAPQSPLLVVPQDATYQKIERISFASDLQHADIAHLLEVNRLLQPYQPEIRCVHVATDKDKYGKLPFGELVELCEAQLPHLNVTFHELVEDDTTEALEAFSLVYHVDLQVMTRPHRSFFGELFHRSQVDKTVKYTHIPLLVLPD